MSENEQDTKQGGVSGNGGFTLPEGYFETSKNQLLTRVSGLEPDRDGFKVPAGYFESSRDKMLQKIAASKAAGQKRLRLVAVRIAAILVFSGIALFYLRPNTVTHKSEIASVAEPGTEDIISYLENDYSQDIPVSEISAVAASVHSQLSTEENYLINQADEQLFIEEL